VTRLRRLLRLDPEERSLLTSALLLESVIATALWLLPFRSAAKLVTRLGASNGKRASDPRVVERVAWAVAAASRHLPFGASCLTQALVSQLLLARRGQDARLRLGVATSGAGKLHAHAWVESEGKIVVGARGAGAYTPLPAFDLERP
jgi:hypothetical protein